VNLRQTARDAVRAEVRDRAMDLFATRGFEETTVDDSVRAVGISARSFFRYFPTKEDVALGEGERWGEQVVQALAQQPDDADPWQAMRDAMQFLVDNATADPERALRDMRVIVSAPSRARAQHGKAPAVGANAHTGSRTARRRRQKTRRLRAQVLVHGSIMCLDVAFAEWVAGDGRTSLNDLLDRAFNELRQNRPATSRRVAAPERAPSSDGSLPLWGDQRQRRAAPSRPERSHRNEARAIRRRIRELPPPRTESGSAQWPRCGEPWLGVDPVSPRAPITSPTRGHVRVAARPCWSTSITGDDAGIPPRSTAGQ
jgi:AcrR family transcriptional regulator